MAIRIRRQRPTKVFAEHRVAARPSRPETYEMQIMLLTGWMSR